MLMAKEGKNKSKAQYSPSANDGLPIDWNADRPDMLAKRASACFTGQSRDEWNAARKNRTNPPDLTKYTPRLAIVRTKAKAAVINQNHVNSEYGTIRKNMQGRA